MTLKWGSTKKAVHAFRVSGGKVHCIKVSKWPRFTSNEISIMGYNRVRQCITVYSFNLKVSALLLIG